MMRKWLKHQKARSLYLKGVRLMHAGMQERAIVEFTHAIEKDAAFLDAYHGRAIGYMETGKWEQGITDEDFVIASDPVRSSAYYYRCMGYMKLMKTDLALDDINWAIHLAPNEPANYMRRGYIHFEQKEYDLAIADTTKSIELGFVHDGHHNRAIYFEEKGDYISAIADWSKIIGFFPKNAKAYCRRGILLEKVGELQDAASDLSIGLKMNEGLSDDLISISRNVLKKLNAMQQNNSRGK